MELLDKALEMLGSLNPMYTAGAATVLEMLFRLIKTPKPLSIAHLIGSGLKKVGSLCTALGDVMDRILPQKTDPPQT